jgi:Tfp pilus assembly protein PilO
MPDISFNRKPGLPVKDRPQVYKNLFFELVLLLVLVFLFGNFLLMPKRGEVKDKRAQLAVLNSQNDSIEQNTAELNALISKMKAAKKDIALLDQALPLESRVTTTQVLLDNLISSSGLTLANIGVDTNDAVIAAGSKELLDNPFGQQRHLQTTSVNVSVTGTMEQFLNFLKSLENNARIIDVSSVQINGNKNNLATFVLTLKTYNYGTAAVIPEGAQIAK